ncbi:hypothetical protein CEXT_298991, partial [Caerostris extrusa]
MSKVSAAWKSSPIGTTTQQDPFTNRKRCSNDP